MSFKIQTPKGRHTRESGYLRFVAFKTEIPAFAEMTKMEASK